MVKNPLKLSSRDIETYDQPYICIVDRTGRGVNIILTTFAVPTDQSTNNTWYQLYFFTNKKIEIADCFMLEVCDPSRLLAGGPSLKLPHSCHLFYTNTFLGLKFLFTQRCIFF